MYIASFMHCTQIHGTVFPLYVKLVVHSMALNITKSDNHDHCK